jgi:hypothetical protein
MITKMFILFALVGKKQSFLLSKILIYSAWAILFSMTARFRESFKKGGDMANPT